MARSRCKKGTRKCKYTNSCVRKTKTKRRLSKCKRGYRQCADKICHKR